MKYPNGPINQHKSLATGASIETCDTSDKETVPSPWGKGTSHPGTVHKSGTSTGKMTKQGTISHKVTPA